MRAVIQRVAEASVSCAGEAISQIGPGMLVLLGVGPTDQEADLEYLARKIAALRIFSDAAGKMNQSVRDVDGSALVVSQFTLYADCRRGNRPSFTGAMEPVRAQALCEAFVTRLSQQGLTVATGRFGADMQLSLVNDGPVTIVLDSQIDR